MCTVARRLAFRTLVTMRFALRTMTFPVALAAIGERRNVYASYERPSDAPQNQNDHTQIFSLEIRHLEAKAQCQRKRNHRAESQIEFVTALALVQQGDRIVERKPEGERPEHTLPSRYIRPGVLLASSLMSCRMSSHLFVVETTPGCVALTSMGGLPVARTFAPGSEANAEADAVGNAMLSHAVGNKIRRRV